MLDSVEALRVRKVQRVQYQRVQNTKNHGVCANGYGQGHNGNSGEARRFAQHAYRVTQVLPKCLHGLAPLNSGQQRASILPSFLSCNSLF